jgi:hypothetical protein
MKPEHIQADFNGEVAQTQAHSIDWIPLGEGIFLNIGAVISAIEAVNLLHPEIQARNILSLH